MADLKKLREDTNKAIQFVRASTTERMCVNWADIGCSQAAHVTTDSGDSYFEVTCDEASPEATEFQSMVADELEKAGWKDVHVVTEW